ncbi:substrate-binding domain-containing protein [uncultured Kordia sp.]|uniref:substrate-binding domain-containing protein n=1 Tax=uncultured Kordia sp. TaxID=507699 RepID=UPI00345C0168
MFLDLYVEESELLLHEINRIGYTVPNDFSLLGFDDIPLANRVFPKLTTIRQDVHEIASTSVEIILLRLNGAKIESRTKVISPKIVKRESVKIIRR